MKTLRLGKSDPQVACFRAGSMAFGEQVDEATAGAILERSLERGVNFVDRAQRYPVAARAPTYSAT